MITMGCISGIWVGRLNSRSGYVVPKRSVPFAPLKRSVPFTPPPPAPKSANLLLTSASISTRPQRLSHTQILNRVTIGSTQRSATKTSMCA